MNDTLASSKCPEDGAPLELVSEDEKERLWRCTKCHLLYKTGK